MENKKIQKTIGIIFLIIAVALIVVALVISLQKGDNKQKDKDEYKQCGEVAEGTNYEHTGINYYIDKDNNRINNSKKIVEKHDSIGEDKEGKLSISDMTVESPNCEERAAVLKAMLKNNSEENLENIMLIIDVKDKDGNYTHKFSITIAKIDAGEELPIEFKTLGRIIDMYDYEFTYVDSSQMAG